MLPYRWTLLLAYPLAFYAAEAFASLKLNMVQSRCWFDVSDVELGFYGFAKQLGISLL